MNQAGEQNAEPAPSSSSTSSASSSSSPPPPSSSSPPPSSSISSNSSSSSSSSSLSSSTSTASETTLADEPRGTAAKKVVSVLKRKRATSSESTPDEPTTDEPDSKKSRLDSGSGDDGEGIVRRKKRRVVFDGVTVFFFRRTQGFTSVPSQGGSTLGMASRHDHIGKFTLKQFALSQEKTHRAILRKQLMERRCQQLRDSPCGNMALREAESDLDEELDNININDYYFLQPIPTKQRRLLLRRAGVKKIDNSEKLELKRIRLSRESCGCDCQMVCNPETCMCSLAGIKCQVDRQSFPCGCTKEGCQNPNGRIEFNPSRVRTHFIHTVMRLDMENRHEPKNLPGERDPDCFEGPPDVSTISQPLDDWAHQPSTSSSMMYSGSLNGRDYYGNGEPAEPGCSSPLYPKSCDAYGSGNSVEENIPVEVHPPRQHDLIPQMLHFNESEDESALTQPIAPLCNVPLPTMPCYDSSEDNLSSSSETTSSSEGSSNYELNECGAPFNFKPTADYNLASSLVQSPEVNSLSQGPSVEGNLPHLTPLEVSNVFSTNRHSVHDSNNKTYTELKQPDSYSSSSFTPGLYNPENSAHSSYSDMFIPYESSKVTESIPLTLSSLAPEPLTYTTCNSPTTSSTYTVLSSLNSVDSLAEMQETALATSKLSSVSFGLTDDPSSSYAQPEPLLFNPNSVSQLYDAASSYPATTSQDDGHGNEAAAMEIRETLPLLSTEDTTDSAPAAEAIVAECSSSGGKTTGPLVDPELSLEDSEEHVDSVQSSQTDQLPLNDTNSNPCCSTTPPGHREFPSAQSARDIQDGAKDAGEAVAAVDAGHAGDTHGSSPEDASACVPESNSPETHCSESTVSDNVNAEEPCGQSSIECVGDSECENDSICPSQSTPSHHSVQPVRTEESQMSAQLPNELVSSCADAPDVCSPAAPNSNGPISEEKYSVGPIAHVDKLPHLHPSLNGKVPVLTHLPNEALVGNAMDLAKKIQVMRGNSEGETTPSVSSISPDSLSPDGAMSDDPFRQADDPSAIDESSFSSSDSAVGHMTGVSFPEISSALPLVQAGLSD
ncbi:uncharacterized protein [Diadema antillarum]|uniref:uncharacterized protein n=1 Tax=Diadema antillarum TaxID=105358 RepID=UPI003A8AB552